MEFVERHRRLTVWLTVGRRHRGAECACGPSSLREPEQTPNYYSIAELAIVASTRMA